MIELQLKAMERHAGTAVGLALLLLCVQSFYTNDWHVLLASDTAWLIKTGQWILEHQCVPHEDVFSWTSAGKSLTVYQWLFAVALGAVFQTGGLWLVGLFTSVVVGLTWLWLLPAQMLSEKVKSAYVFGLLSLTMNSAWFWARPQLVSFILIIVFINVLENFRRTGNRALLWCLPLLMVLWTNCHSFWFIGLMLAAVYLLPRLTQGSTRERAFLLAIVATCTLAVVANPYGVNLIGYNLSFLHEPDFGSIWELQPHLLLQPVAYAPILTYLIFTWIFLILGRKSVPAEGLVMASLATFAGLMFFRFVPVAVLLTWPYLSMALGQFRLFQSHQEIFWCKQTTRNLALPALAVLTSAVAFVATFMPGNPVWFTHGNSNFAAVKLLKAHPELTRAMFTDSNVGCSLILEDLTPVFIDSRFDFYGKSFCDACLSCLKGEDGWRKYLSNYHINAVCIGDQYPLYRELQHDKEWLKVFDDGSTSIWLVNTGSNQRIARSLGSGQVSQRTGAVSR